MRKSINHYYFVLFILIALVDCSKESSVSNARLGDSKITYMTILGTEMILSAIPEDSPSLQTKAGDATHYRVKFYPKSIEEQQYLDGLNGVSMSYVPFGYELVPDKSVDTKLECDPFAELNPYTERNIAMYCNDSRDNNKERIIHLPIMYAIWPINRTLPENIEYTIDSFISMRGVPIEEDTRYPLKIQTYDSLLGAYVPLKNIKVRVSYMGVSAYQYTDNTGLVRIYTGLANITNPSQIPSITITVLTAGRTWTICPQESTIPYQTAIGTIGDLWPTSVSTVTVNMISSTIQYEVFRATEYYHSVSNVFYPSILSSEQNPIIHICPQDLTNPDMQGSTNPQTKTVDIYHVGLSQPEEIAVVLHELAHIRKWHQLGQTSPYDTDLWTHESYSCFLGAYLGEQYYLNKGFVKPYSDYFINTMGQQHTWIIGSLYAYSPFYIDLIDSYNQNTYMYNLPYDEIQDVPVSLVDSLGIVSTSKNQSMAAMSDFVNVYYTLTQMNTFLSNY